MAKSSRSSRGKLNKSKLRSNVFGPAEVARKKRLSAKLIELASNPQPKSEEDMKVASGEKVATQETHEEFEAHITAGEDAMSMDQAKQPIATTESVPRSTSRVRRGKARAAMVFPIYKKGKRDDLRLSAKERKKRIE